MKEKDLLLEVNNLTISFNKDKKENIVTSGISFKLHRGETIGIVGESGSGKSVTSLCIMKLLDTNLSKIHSGQIKFYNTPDKAVDLINYTDKEMQSIRGKSISMIFQEPMTSLNPVMKCGRQVMEAIVQHTNCTEKEAKEKTINLFNEVKLPRPETIFNSYPHEISGGQKQRVMIAMALSTHPSILIADEPTTALDVTVQKSIIELLNEIKAKYNIGIIFITHDISLINEIADNIIVMYKGKIVEQGTKQVIFTKPSHPYTNALLSCKPSTLVRYKILPTVTDFINDNNVLANFKSEANIENLNQREERHKELYSNEPIIKIKNLTKYYTLKYNLYGKPIAFYKAFENINIDVYKGETLGLVGESGCGKTTLGNCIVRLVDTTAGEIVFNNNNIVNFKGKELLKIRKDIQIIFQDPYSSLNPKVKIGEAILEPMKIHKLYSNNSQRKERVNWLLKKVGLSENDFNLYPHQFSGGQRQRICIARALAVNPQIIICDEAVSALDVSVQAQVLNLLNELKAEFGLTYIFISHDLSVVKYISDRIAVMNKGQIAELNEADILYNNPQNDYTIKLIESSPKI